MTPALYITIAALSGLMAGYLIASVIIKNKVRGDLIGFRKEKELMNLRLSEAAERLKEFETFRQENIRLKEETAGFKARLEAEQKATSEKLEILKNAKEQLSEQFKALASEIFDVKSRQFRESNEKELKSILLPFQERISDFKKQVNDAYQIEIRERASLKEQIHQLTQLNQRISLEAENLTNALKGQSQTQGAWGEMIMESVLEQSGLRRGQEYEIQVSMENEENRRLRPDAVVHIPGNRDIVIDSKVSLTAYEQFVASDREEEKAAALKAHIASIKNHIKALKSKDYASLPGLKTVDFVLMFVPIEGAFSLAVQNDNSLFNEAFQNRIVIVSPSTLFATLRTIENSWRFERQTQNAQEIARKAGLLYDKFIGFLGDMDKVGKGIDSARQSYEEALGKLKTGKGNLIRKAEELKDLGAQTGKQIPADFLDISDDGE